jgi:hypothetical protein
VSPIRRAGIPLVPVVRNEIRKEIMMAGGWHIEPPPRRGMARIKCVICGQHERRMWPLARGHSYVYAGICRPCKEER